MRLAALIGLLATAGLVALLWSGPAGRARLGLPAGWGGITEPAAAPSPAALPGLPAHSRDLAPGTRTVHKCVVDGRVSYSDDAQCGGRGQALRIDMGANVLPSVAPAASVAAAASPAQAELSPAPAHPSRRPPGP